MTRRALSVLVLALAACAGPLPADVDEFDAEARAARAADVPVSVALSPVESVVGPNARVLVRVELRNTSAKAVRLPAWLLPSAELEAPLFRVSVDGVPVAYTGPIYKRAAPTAEDFVALAAGARLVRVADLTDSYDFSRTGSYAIRYAVLDRGLAASAGVKGAARLKSGAVEVWIEGREAKGGAAPAPDAVTGASTFYKCSGTQQAALLTARSAASTYADDAFAYLSGGATGPRYVTWFGAVEAGRYETARGHFGAIAQALSTATVDFDCSCKKKNVYAYVYPNRPYDIFLCGYFWVAPATGTDSKAGTLVHETSHFDVVAGTDDFVYGQAAAKNLALTAPWDAVMNADNHEYFAENTPLQN